MPLSTPSPSRRAFLAFATTALPLLAFPGASQASEAQPMFVISGELTYRQRIALPDNATAIIEVKPSDAADGEAVTGEFRIDLKGMQVPVPFTLHVARDRFTAGTVYQVRGGIEVDGQIRWLSDPVEIDHSQTEAKLGTLLLKPHEPAAPFDLTAPADIQNVDWTIVTLGTETVDDATRLTLLLDADGSFSGKACNRYRGSYTIKPGEIAFGNAAATMMACAEPLMKLERALFNALDEAANFQLTAEQQLIITDATGTSLITARR